MKIQKLTEAQKAQILGDLMPQSNNPVFWPRRLISLWEMNQILTEKFLVGWIAFLRQYDNCEIAKEDPMAVLNADDRASVTRALEAFQWECEKLGFTESIKRSKEIIAQLNDVAWHWDGLRRQATLRGLSEPRMPNELPPQTFLNIYSLLRTLGRVAQDELEKIRLVVVKSDKAKYFEHSDLFGPDVAREFPAAKEEIRDAGNCLAVELNTSAVFHLMRASEIGLRALAVELEACREPHPMEFGQWSDVIGSIRTVLEKREKAFIATGKGFQKDASLDRCRALLADISLFKMTRDRVMHTRSDDYSSDEAALLFEKVKTFMHLLAATNFNPILDYQI